MDFDRLASYSSVVLSTYSTILSFIRLAQAGFRYTGEGLSIVCDGCQTLMDMVEFIEGGNMLDPRRTRFHDNRCNFVCEPEAADLSTNDRGTHHEDTDEGINGDGQHLSTLNSPSYVGHGTSNGTLVNNISSTLETQINGTCSGNGSLLPKQTRNDVQNSSSPETTSPVYKVLTHPSYPVFISYTKRLESFTNWQHHHIHQPEHLARAGFFYAGYSDCVRCFQCGLGLRSWKPGDDVYQQHRKHRPSCPFLGTQETPNGVQGQREPINRGDEYPSEDVITHSSVTTVDDITVSLLKRESTKLKERLLCKVCQKEPIKELFLPCGDLYACSDCSKLLSHCPACHKLILATSSVYLT